MRRGSETSAAHEAGELGSVPLFVADFRVHVGSRLRPIFAFLFPGAALQGVGLLQLLPILTVTVGSTAGDEWRASPRSSHFSKGLKRR